MSYGKISCTFTRWIILHLPKLSWQNGGLPLLIPGEISGDISLIIPPDGTEGFL